MFALHYLEIIEGSSITTIRKCSREIGNNFRLQYFFVCIFPLHLPFKIGLVKSIVPKENSFTINGIYGMIEV